MMTRNERIGRIIKVAYFRHIADPISSSQFIIPTRKFDEEEMKSYVIKDQKRYHAFSDSLTSWGEHITDVFNKANKDDHPEGYVKDETVKVLNDITNSLNVMLKDDKFYLLNLGISYNLPEHQVSALKEELGDLRTKMIRLLGIASSYSNSLRNSKHEDIFSMHGPISKLLKALRLFLQEFKIKVVDFVKKHENDPVPKREEKKPLNMFTHFDEGNA